MVVEFEVATQMFPEASRASALGLERLGFAKPVPTAAPALLNSLRFMLPDEFVT